ncbi:MAG: GAF domain-containing sensor histidine kinase [Rhizomicrobium sp.]
MTSDFQADIDAIERLSAVPTILEVVCRTTGMGFAAVARVTSDRWIACSVRDEIAFGLTPGGELKVETTICHEIRQSGEPVVIDHVAQSATWCTHHTPALYGFQSYISMPILLRDGSFFGTLCAIDPRPAQLDNPQIRGMFRLFADLIAFHLDAEARAATSEASLLDERHSAELREQFIAVLGHDLRNPLASIDAGTRLLAREQQSEKAKGIVTLMHGSVQRMSRLIDNVMDFARGRLGGGFTLHRAPTDLAPTLEQVVAELRAANPGREIATRFDMSRAVNCDAGRIAQLLSNLLGNALMHGADPMRVEASTNDGVFVLSVANAGTMIQPEDLQRLFVPFVRGGSQQGGLGLGLYIAAEIAKAHHGTLAAGSTPDETRFTFRMRLQ